MRILQGGGPLEERLSEIKRLAGESEEKPQSASKPSDKGVAKGKNNDKSNIGKKWISPKCRWYRRRDRSGDFWKHSKAPSKRSSAKQCGMEEQEDSWSEWESCSEGEPGGLRINLKGRGGSSCSSSRGTRFSMDCVNKFCNMEEPKDDTEPMCRSVFPGLPEVQHSHCSMEERVMMFSCGHSFQRFP